MVLYNSDHNSSFQMRVSLLNLFAVNTAENTETKAESTIFILEGKIFYVNTEHPHCCSVLMQLK